MTHVPGVQEVGSVRFLVPLRGLVVLEDGAALQVDEGPPELLPQALPRSPQDHGSAVAVPMDAARRKERVG